MPAPDALTTLYNTLLTRKDAAPESSYTASLLAKGRSKITQKLGEEAIELVIAGIQQDHDEIINESADLLYHWLVLLVDAGVSPDEVMAALTKRQGKSGLQEKASRKT